MGNFSKYEPLPELTTRKTIRVKPQCFGGKHAKHAALRDMANEGIKTYCAFLSVNPLKRCLLVPQSVVDISCVKEVGTQDLDTNLYSHEVTKSIWAIIECTL